MKNIPVGDNIDDFKKVDARISYPSYKSLDEFLSITDLRALDRYIIERIENHIKAEKDDFFLNLHRLDEALPYQPGVREIWLSRPDEAAKDGYLQIDDAKLWHLTEAAEEFALLMDFIGTLPFRAIGRMLIIYDNAGAPVPPHRDHLNADVCYEFVWFRTNKKKPFYVLNEQTDEKKYIESYAAWFDTVNQYHGADAAEGLNFSIRVDGKFTDEFRNKIPKPSTNPASTASFWATVG